MLFTSKSNINQLLEASVILFDKPLEWTSFDLVKKIKYTIAHHFHIKQRNVKIGHAGTLDPLATGLLILCTGKATKQIENIQNDIKTYTGTLHLGATTPSYDLETDINETFDTQHITKEMCQAIAESFLGEQMQTPPIYSAIWVDGKRAYDLARKGKEVELKQRPITISKFEIDTQNFPEIAFEIECTKGTYIRSIAHDFGQKLNNGAYLSSLQRTKIGTYQIEEAWTIESFTQFLNQHKHADL